ncbi:NAD(P)-dependent oxidoreductase [Streptomyces sp. N50]|uniref:NAD(P)-dependent oxidoreductase n=1 Tax=Streptomyces sp. N50 TaxID=3081765 RepID=UPI0029623758|nr:NAD(P)-dependent oxidoreductase [Streptomyces sp. N50]WOX16663.1 NAD(P)-dependent oxidoreductase [Streptomyces sp. N50]
MRIGVIGSGRMGRPIVDRLMTAGHDVTMHTRRPETRAIAQKAGASWADTIEETVRGADAVFVVVLTDEQVRSVCLGPDGALAAMSAGATLVQHTTSDPETARLLFEAGAQRGVGVLDAALSGGPHDIAAGRLTLWVGGDEAQLEQTRPLLEAYASPILFVGPAGSGQRVKLVNNALFVAQVGLAVDAVRVAGSLGIDENVILTALQHGSGASRALDVVARGGSVDSVAVRLADLMSKDVAMVREVARSTGADLGIIGTVLSSDAVEKKVLQRPSS